MGTEKKTNKRIPDLPQTSINTSGYQAASAHQALTFHPHRYHTALCPKGIREKQLEPAKIREPNEGALSVVCLLPRPDVSNGFWKASNCTLECWATHEEQLKEATAALFLPGKLEAMDSFRGYGPSGPLGNKNRGCILEEAVESETQQSMVLFRTFGVYLQWVEAAQIVRRSITEAILGVKDTRMSEGEILKMMKPYQEAWRYAVEYDLAIGFCPAFYDTIPFKMLQV